MALSNQAKAIPQPHRESNNFMKFKPQIQVFSASAFGKSWFRMKIPYLACVMAMGLAACSVGPGTMTVKIIALNDFHGNLQSPGKFKGVEAGGVDVLAAYVDRLKSQNPLNAVVSAGDLIGASALISALFHDEGTIETMNRLGLEFNAVGNHEFDDGQDELLRMQYGGCHPTDHANSCKGSEVGTPVPFEGAKFRFLAANVRDRIHRRTLFPGYAIKTFNGIPVAFIGLTLQETPTIVMPSGVAGLTFDDEATTINQVARALRRQGNQAIIVLIHQGGTPTNASDINACAGELQDSPIRAIVRKLDDAIDLVISGHTHAAYICQIANRTGRLIPVTSADALGRILTDINLTVDPSTRDVVAVTARNLVVDRGEASIVPNLSIQSIVDQYAHLATSQAQRVIGSISTDFLRAPNEAGESVLGDLIADAQLSATRDSEHAHAQIAFVNPGGIRTDLIRNNATIQEEKGNVIYGAAFMVQPFGNSLVTMSLTGAQIQLLLEQQFMDCTAGYPSNNSRGQPLTRILQVSEGFSYAWDSTALPCHQVVPDSILIHGEKLQPSAEYRVTVSSFLADGGDQFYVLRQGTHRLGGPQDIDALESYLKTHEPIAPGPQNRIRKVK
jgi:5'-nucleotidase